MADVLLLFLAALLVLGSGAAAAMIARAGHRRKVLEWRDQPRRQRQELDQIDDYIRQVGQATADEDLDRLARNYKEQQRWDGSSSR